MKQRNTAALITSAQLLILANIITIVLAVWQKWDLNILLWVYWFQSVIIGFFQAKKISDLKQFSTKNFRINDQSVEPTESTKRWVVRFFLFHFNFFHLAYFVFLAGRPGEVVWTYVFVGAGAFFLNHLFSYRLNEGNDSTQVPNIGTMMFFPYARIIPMHLIIIFGSFLSFTTFNLVLFLSLKTVADLIMHVVEHKTKNPV